MIIPDRVGRLRLLTVAERANGEYVEVEVLAQHDDGRIYHHTEWLDRWINDCDFHKILAAVADNIIRRMARVP